MNGNDTVDGGAGTDTAHAGAGNNTNVGSVARLLEIQDWTRGVTGISVMLTDN